MLHQVVVEVVVHHFQEVVEVVVIHVQVQHDLDQVLDIVQDIEHQFLLLLCQ
jgi:hypothetical protein